MAQKRVLVTGVTGYIGGSVSSTLLDSKDDLVAESSISVLVRGKDKAATLEKEVFKPVIFDSLDATEQLRDIASKYDGQLLSIVCPMRSYGAGEVHIVVIGCTSGYHPASAKALIEGLAVRKQQTGSDVHYVHTSGTSNVADHLITQPYRELREFSDTDTDLYSYCLALEALEPYAQRTTDITVISTGVEKDVKTYIIMSPLIYGLGSGPFNRLTIQVPSMIRAALKSGYVEMIGEGHGVWDHVHIADLAELYKTVLKKILVGENIPYGERGYYFSANGRHSWREVADGIARALVNARAIGTGEVRSVGLDEAARDWFGGYQQLAELGAASNSKTKSDLSRSLGWEPQIGDGEFRNHFQVEVDEILKKDKKGE